jgi:Archaeal putative transposase ISC1217.
VNLGQDVHGGSFPLRREEDVGFVRVNEFKTEIDVAREMLDVLKGYFRVSMVVFDSSTVREAREGQRGV